MADEPSPAVAQAVSNSFIGGHNIQLGAVTGDVTLTLDRPGYRLELLQPTTETRRIPRSRRTPSYLLDVQRHVVPFRDRPEQALLRQWRDDPDEPVSVRLLHGAGGQGKTRLANAFASSCHAQGWSVAQAVEKTPRMRPGTLLSAEAGGREPPPLLIVADYAERWALPVLTQLIEDLVWDFPDRVLRVLLLARPGEGLWDNLQAELQRTSADLADPVPLGAFTSVQDRPLAYREAAAVFAAQLGYPQRPPEFPEDLAHPDYASPLTLHMAALAAVCADHEETAHPGRADLSEYLLSHERRQWSALAGEGDAQTAVVERTVFLATLFGPADTMQAARTLLQRACLADGPAQASGLLRSHARLYPPAQETSGERPGAEGVVSSWLLPLKPDRFGEDFVAQHLRQSDAVETLKALLQAADGDPMEQSAVRQCLIVLTVAAQRHLRARAVLFDLLAARPALVRHATAGLIQLIIGHADLPLAARLYDALPAYSTHLLRASCDFARYLLSALPFDAPSSLRASRLAAFGVRLSGVGDKRGALEPTREAVEIRRRLAEAEPAAHLPNLAMSLFGYARVRTIGTLELPQALTAIDEAVELYEQLAKAFPAALDEMLRAARSMAVEVRGKRDLPEDPRDLGDLGRNAACSCGSGKKHKRCCGAPELSIDQYG